MNKVLPLVGAAALAAALSFTAIAPAQAHFYPGYAVGAGVLGFMAGAAIASSNRGYYDDGYYNDGYYAGGGWRAHVAACEDAYRSYVAPGEGPRSIVDTYVGYDGNRHQCML
jgi:hypothetical protein